MTASERACAACNAEPGEDCRPDCTAIMSALNEIEDAWVPPIGNPDAEPEDMGSIDADAHGPVFAPLIDALPRRQEPWCRCGWHESNHPGFTVADHLADMRPNT